mgnify:CR=1 FL=1
MLFFGCVVAVASAVVVLVLFLVVVSIENWEQVKKGDLIKLCEHGGCISQNLY